MNETLDPAAFTMEAVLDRVANEGDLFEGVLTRKQSLSEALKSVRLRGSFAQSVRVPEARELGNVAAEEQRRRPVDDHAELSAQQWQLV